MAWLVLEQYVGGGVTITVPPSDQPTVIRVSPSKIRDTHVAIGYQAPREVEIVRDDAVRKQQQGDRQ